MAEQTVRRILVVEDDPTMTEMLSILLEETGCEIVTASTGEQALDLAREQALDLVTLDLGLPGMDGRELLRRFRLDPQTTNVPVIVVTAMRFDRSADERIAAVLQKPFDCVELEEAVRGVLDYAQRPSRLA